MANPNYGICSHAGKKYVVAYSPPHGYIGIVGKHIRKLIADPERGEIQCRIPAPNEKEKYDKLRGSANGVLDDAKEIADDPDVPKKIRNDTENVFNALRSCRIITCLN